MAHGFRNLGRNTTFATRKELAWHGLGVVVDSMTSKEAIILGGLDYEVGLKKLYVVDDGVQINSTFQSHFVDKERFTEMPSNFATYRKDTQEVFNVVGARYVPVQNTDAFEFFDSIIGEGHAKYETVGALGNGERVFITAKLPKRLIVNKEDIDQYLLLTTSHDGSGAIMVMFTPVRVVCNNTLSLALQGRNKVSIRHTKNAKTRLEKAKEILGIIDYNSQTLQEYYNSLTNTVVNDAEAKKFFEYSFNMKKQEDGKYATRTQNKLNDIIQYYHQGVGQEGIQGTSWGVFNAVTGYLQNGTNRDDERQFINTYIKGDEGIRERFILAQKSFVNA